MGGWRPGRLSVVHQTQLYIRSALRIDIAAGNGCRLSIETNGPVPLDERTRCVRHRVTNERQPRRTWTTSRVVLAKSFVILLTNVDDPRHQSPWADAGIQSFTWYYAHTYYVSRVGLLSHASSSELSERWFTRSGAYSTPGWHGSYSTDGRGMLMKKVIALELGVILACDASRSDCRGRNVTWTKGDGWYYEKTNSNEGAE